MTVTVLAAISWPLLEEDGSDASGEGVDCVETEFPGVKVTVMTDGASTDLGSSGFAVTVTVLIGCFSVETEGSGMETALKTVSTLAGGSG